MSDQVWFLPLVIILTVLGVRNAWSAFRHWGGSLGYIDDIATANYLGYTGVAVQLSRSELEWHQKNPEPSLNLFGVLFGVPILLVAGLILACLLSIIGFCFSLFDRP